MKKMIVVGAGAAGMMTAIKAADRYSVTLIERNDRPGRKLYLTGKGRCNVTNASDEEEFLRNVVSNPKFLYSAIYNYNQNNAIQDFQSWGVPLKTERGNRVFPVSDHSSDIIKAMRKQLKKKRVSVIYDARVSRILTRPYTGDDPKDKYRLIAYGVEYIKNNEKSILEADTIVIATGGRAYPQTGSTGDGLKWLNNLGIDTIPSRPSLVPLETEEDDPERMMGLALKNVRVRVIAPKSTYTYLKKDRLLYEGFGEMLFTHFGVSGPLCLSASSYISSFLFEKEALRIPTRLNMLIDLKPALDMQELDERICRDFEEFSRREYQNSLGKLLPRLMIPVIVSRSRIRPDKRVSDITLEERRRLCRLLKEFPLTITGLRDFNEAIITGGGIAVREINPKNMELRTVKNLRVSGEIIDCDALTGGFNLQIAWSTAVLASE